LPVILLVKEGTKKVPGKKEALTMMYFESMGGWGMGFGWFLMAVLVGLVIWGIYTLVNGQRAVEHLTALEILQRRYARREISQAEYEQAVRTLY
jgi:uncharacterized membrane protein